MNIRITLTDDHPLIISGLQNMLRYHPHIEIIGQYTSGADLLKSLKTVQPDVALLDIQMPGQQGDEIAAVISKLYPLVNILALTNLDSPYYIKSMLQQDGVRGYILKTSGEEALVKAIGTVANGDTYMEPILKERAQKAMHPKSTDLNPVLTRREKEVLQLMAEDHSSQDISKMLFLSKRTVDNHRTSILLKLEARNSASLIKKAMDLGLIK